MDKFYEPIGLIITFMLPVAFLRLFWGGACDSHQWPFLFVSSVFMLARSPCFGRCPHAFSSCIIVTAVIAGATQFPWSR